MWTLLQYVNVLVLLLGIWTVASEENPPPLGLGFGLGLALEIGFGGNFPRGQLS